MRTSSGEPRVARSLSTWNRRGIHAALFSVIVCGTSTRRAIAARAAAFASRRDARPVACRACLRSKSAGELGLRRLLDPHSIRKAPSQACDRRDRGRRMERCRMRGARAKKGVVHAWFRQLHGPGVAAWVTRLVGADRAPALLASYPATILGPYALPTSSPTFITTAECAVRRRLHQSGAGEISRRKTPTFLSVRGSEPTGTIAAPAMSFARHMVSILRSRGPIRLTCSSPPHGLPRRRGSCRRR